MENKISQTRIKGVLQNSEFIMLALNENRAFVIPCKSAKDADSKRVSLYCTRKKLKEADQKVIRIQKELMEGTWVVRIWKEESQVLELIDGELSVFKENQDESD